MSNKFLEVMKGKSYVDQALLLAQMLEVAVLDRNEFEKQLQQSKEREAKLESIIEGMEKAMSDHVSHLSHESWERFCDLYNEAEIPAETESYKLKASKNNT